MRRAALSTLVLALVACSKKEPPAEKKEPWLAHPPDARSALRAKYVVGERCEAKLDLRAKEAAPKGTFRVCKGELDVNLSDLADSRGSFAVDVASIEMRGEGDAGRSDEQTQEAQNWLDVGASRPEAERERARWAVFTITSLAEASSASAHTGRRERAAPDAEEPAQLADEDAGAAEPRERRTVTLLAKGHLLLHRVRVDLEVPVRVAFHYTGKAGADAVPEKLSLTTRKPVLVSLAAHDIKPRDSAGVFQAQGTKLIGTKVGTDARVTVSISAALAKP